MASARLACSIDDAGAGFSTYVYSRELPPSPRIDLVAAIGATYLSTQTTTFVQVAAQIGNIDLIYEAVGHSHFTLEAVQAAHESL